MYHVPMCKVCGEWEVGTFIGSDKVCSEKCGHEAHDFLELVYMDTNRDEVSAMENYFEDEADYHGSWDCEAPTEPDNFMDDADVLASAGFGTDEDYGYYGDDY